MGVENDESVSSENIGRKASLVLQELCTFKTFKYHASKRIFLLALVLKAIDGET
jgi:hypothetical protein